MPKFAIIDAPSILGLKPTGVDGLPAALLKNGLADRLGARRAGRVVPENAYDPNRPAPNAVLNEAGIAAYSPRLADIVGNVLDQGEFPVVLGGDCSILLGNGLALRRRGRYGLLFLDGHADFYQPEANPIGEAADMDLALATGRGPKALTDLEGRRPLFRDEDVAVFGFRDEDESQEYGSQPLPTEMLGLNLAEIARLGLEAALAKALSNLNRADLDGFWVHLDADVIDDDVMPAVDYRLPGGLSFGDITIILRQVLAPGHAVGLEVTIFNPKLDETGDIAGQFTTALVTGLTA